MNANTVCRLGLCGAGELRTPDPLTDTPLEGEPMTKAYEIAQQRRAHEKTFAYSIGPAVDLAELDTQFRAWLKTPWLDDEIMQPEQTR